MHFTRSSLFVLVSMLAYVSATPTPNPNADPLPLPEPLPQIHCDLLVEGCSCPVKAWNTTVACTEYQTKWLKCEDYYYSPC
ncbi:hypothetical protein SISNIDRAFT_452383 [Sistotremastrum niveocremeum HHB9708]|uniref:CBM1 domain-containing protein n=1 Tax=Sistotremastrum niveocremeum HHB9708 TaxID=1314777 RepID=A0A164WIC8_9AGAM|nr:hypothetical protein SISNIDRAFT_452383 [Sistotremastrum niveocremeum HHB9708]